MPMFVVYGWIASTVLFIIETICNKFRLLQIETFRNSFAMKLGHHRSIFIEK